MELQELRDTLTLILAGGTGTRLKPLTLRRAKPAVPFGGAYRIIDFTLSNCIHSGLRRIHVLTQYQARSLDEHIRFGWNFLPRRLQQFISVRPPHHGGSERWYMGTADAIYRNLDTIEQERPSYVLILSGDHIYKMDYARMLSEHLERKSKLTIGAVRVPASECDQFGIFEVDDQSRVIAFDEKPADGKQIPGDPGYCLASMGIYLFDTDELIRRLHEDADLGEESKHDFGKDVIPRMVEEASVLAYPFSDGSDGSDGTGGSGGTAAAARYWRDVGTIEAYYEANLDLCNVEPQFNLYETSWPTYTLWHNDPPAKAVLGAEIVEALLCPGVVVSGGKVSRSVISNRARLEKGCDVDESVIFSGVVVGQGAKIRRAIVDKWVVVPEGEEIGFDLERDAERFSVSDDGIVVVPQSARF